MLLDGRKLRSVEKYDKATNNFVQIIAACDKYYCWYTGKTTRALISGACKATRFRFEHSLIRIRRDSLICVEILTHFMIETPYVESPQRYIYIYKIWRSWSMIGPLGKWLTRECVSVCKILFIASFTTVI